MKKTLLAKLLSLLLVICAAFSYTGCGIFTNPQIQAIQDEIDQSQASAPSEVPEKPENAKEPAHEGPQKPDGQAPQNTSEPETTMEPEEEKEQEASPRPAQKPDDTQEDGTEDSISLNIPEVQGVFTIPDYYKYDDAMFMEECPKITDAGEAGDADKLLEIFEKLDNELNIIDSLYTTADLNANLDVTDTTWGDETEYCLEIYYDCHDTLYAAMRKAAETGNIDYELKEYFGEEEFQNILEFEETPDDIVEKELKLTNLENKYNDELNNCYDMPYTYKGTDYTLMDLIDGSINTLAYSDYDSYIKVYTGILKNINDVLGPIFIEMIGLRTEIAEYYGYDNFAAYAYEEDYGRDYTLDDAEKYCNIIKENIAEDYNDAYYAANFNTSYSEDPDEILDAMDRVTESLDSEIHEGFRYLTETETYSIGSEDTRLEGCYTTYFPYEKIPFIFINTYGNGSGFDTLTHEFGHYLNFLVESTEEETWGEYNLDIMEIQSNSMQLMCTNFYDQVYGEQAAEAEAEGLLNSIYQVVSGCVYDEFQRKIYENPDMTLEELNMLFADVNSDYGTYELDNYDYTWVLNNHMFDAPMYYISYSVSSLGALNMWKNSHDDLESAVEQYKKIITYDKPGIGTIEFEEACGLTTMNDEKGITDICMEALGFINQTAASSGDIWEMLQEILGEDFDWSMFEGIDPENLDWDSLRDMGFDFDFGNEPPEAETPNAA